MCISLSTVICRYVTLSETWRKEQSVDHLFWIKQNTIWTCVMGLELSKTFVIGLILFQVILAVLSLFGALLVQRWNLNNRKITWEFHGALHDHSCQYVLKIWTDAPSSMEVFQTEMVLLSVAVHYLEWISSSTWGNPGFQMIDLEMGRKKLFRGHFLLFFQVEELFGMSS